MNSSKIVPEVLVQKLEWPVGNVRVVLDTDTYNEVDDQFALAYALASPEKITLEAIYAAPFHNNRSSGPDDGMIKSYNEILKILSKMNINFDGMVYKGSCSYLQAMEKPVESDAAYDLISRAMKASDRPLYVVAIGAITNIASAILIKPEIINNIVLVWLGGNAFFWHDNREFNLIQDIIASRFVFDCGVPLIHIPCAGVTTHLRTTIPELEYYLKGKSEIADYLLEIVKGYTDDPFAWSKVIWDVAAIAWLIDSQWVGTQLVPSPIVTDQMTWSFDNNRHFIKSAYMLDRDKIFKDLFKKLTHLSIS